MSVIDKMVGSHALILSGGGAQAAYEVGVLSGLLTGQSPATGYRPLDPNILIGTSAGSINACLLLSAASAGLVDATNYMEQVWMEDMATASGKCGGGIYHLRIGPISTNAACLIAHPLQTIANIAGDGGVIARSAVTRGIDFVMSGGAIEQRALELVDLSALISIQPFVDLIHKRIRLDEIQKASCTLKVAATNWRTGVIRVFDKSEMTDALGYQVLLASSALPGVFPSVEIEGDPYVDGGLVMNTPLKPAIDAGADTLHIICMDPDISRVPLPRAPSTTAVFSRSIEINFRSALVQDIEYATQVNHAIAVLSGASPSSDVTVQGGRHLFREAVTRMTKPETTATRRSLTMHLYYPSGGLNVGWLNFEEESIARLINRGREDAIHHDCTGNGCVFPEEA